MMLPEGIQGMSGTLNRTGLYACRKKTHTREVSETQS